MNPMLRKTVNLVTMISFFNVVMLALFGPVVEASTCCNTPTVWILKNQDKSPLSINCTLEKSPAWDGKPIVMSTGVIKPGSLYKHQWDRNWYSDGMGMIPGEWQCKTSDSKAAVRFTTDWGENVSLNINATKVTVVGKPQVKQ
jgi:hypothetical protein